MSVIDHWRVRYSREDGQIVNATMTPMNSKGHAIAAAKPMIGNRSERQLREMVKADYRYGDEEIVMTCERDVVTCEHCHGEGVRPRA